MEINGKHINAGEVIGFFDKIQIANFQEITNTVAARGGWDNRGHVFWTTAQEIRLTFSQGVFSPTQFGLMLNANLIRPLNDKINIHQREKVETDEDGKFTLKYQPDNEFFVYDTDGNLLEVIQEEEEKSFSLSSKESFKELVVDYNYIYDNGAGSFVIGQELIKGDVSLEGRTRIKEDTTGKITTGIIRIPRMRIVSNLSMRLGNQANPVVGTLQAIGYPVGSRGNSKIMEIHLLNNDIDSDL